MDSIGGVEANIRNNIYLHVFRKRDHEFVETFQLLQNESKQTPVEFEDPSCEFYEIKTAHLYYEGVFDINPISFSYMSVYTDIIQEG